MRVLYFDCIAGISGDMTLGALVDAGVSLDDLRAALSTLPLEPFELESEQVEAHGITATRVVVRTGTAGIIRTYASIRELIDQGELSEAATHTAQRVFHRLAQAEAMVHRKDVEQVTFHEVGAVDSIVDICGVAVGLDLLGVERVYSSPVPTGFGMTRSDHGAMPIPAPAVVELLRGAPMFSRGVQEELTTPTGAAILAALSEGFGEMPAMRIEAAGYGLGTHELADMPNLLRVLIGQTEDPSTAADAAEGSSTATAWSSELVLETNIDDLNPELYEYVLEQLFASGAQDAWLTPIVMKKSRPAVKLSVLCSPQDEAVMRGVIFRETGTLGIRVTDVTKHALEREIVKVETRWGTVGVKVGHHEGAATTLSPEFADCTRVAREAGVPAKEVYEEALRLTREQLDR